MTDHSKKEAPLDLSGIHSKKMISSEQLKQHKEYMRYLKNRFGKEFNKKKRQGKTGCAYAPAGNDLIDSDQAFREIRAKYDRAYDVTRENLGKYLFGKKPPIKISRRNYLKFMGMALASVSLPYTFAFCTLPCQTMETSEGQMGCEEPGSTDETSVAMVKNQSTIEDAVRRAVDLAGGLVDIQPGESVLIKPNCVWPTGAQALPFADKEKAPVFTNPEVVRAVIRLAKEKNQDPLKIFVGDEGAFPNRTLDNMITQGMYDVAIEEGVNVLPFEETDYVCYQSDKFEFLDYPFHISSVLSGFDHLINVPVLKNHELNLYPVAQDQAQFSCCLKAMVGVMMKTDRQLIGKNFHELELPSKVAEIHLCRPYQMLNGKPGITMNIVDATSIVIAGGPHNSIFFEEMVVEHPGMIIASKDRVACDTVALSVLKHYGSLRLDASKNYIATPVWDQKQIVHAAHLGLGINDPNRIEVIQQGVSSEEMTAIMAMWNQTVPLV